MPARSSIAIVAAVVAVQWIAVLALVGFTVRGLVLAGLAAVLVVGVAEAAGGRAAGILAGAFWVAAPAVLGFWRADFQPHWQHELLPVLYGGRDSARLLAGLALLGVVLCLLRLRPPLAWAAAVALLIAAAALVRLDHATLSFSWSAFTLSLARIREVGWSLRLVEYLPLAGLVGVLLRRPRAGALLAALLLAALLVPLGRDRVQLLRDALVVVPGLPIYAVLVGCLVLLVPARLRQSSARA